jgi:hypothetical protein
MSLLFLSRSRPSKFTPSPSHLSSQQFNFLQLKSLSFPPSEDRTFPRPRNVLAAVIQSQRPVHVERRLTRWSMYNRRQRWCSHPSSLVSISSRWAQLSAGLCAPAHVEVGYRRSRTRRIRFLPACLFRLQVSSIRCGELGVHIKIDLIGNYHTAGTAWRSSCWTGQGDRRTRRSIGSRQVLGKGTD